MIGRHFNLKLKLRNLKNFKSESKWFFYEVSAKTCENVLDGLDDILAGKPFQGEGELGRV